MDRLVSTVLVLVEARRVPASTVSPCSTQSFSTFTVAGTVRSSTLSLVRLPLPETVALMEPVVTVTDLTLLPLWAVTDRCTRCRTYSVPASPATRTTATMAMTR